jgi:hypothetical protein
LTKRISGFVGNISSILSNIPLIKINILRLINTLLKTIRWYGRLENRFDWQIYGNQPSPPPPAHMFWKFQHRNKSEPSPKSLRTHPLSPEEFSNPAARKLEDHVAVEEAADDEVPRADVPYEGTVLNHVTGNSRIYKSATKKNTS